MKLILKIKLAILSLLILSSATGYAQPSANVEKTVNEIVKKYDGTSGVSCITVVKGGGLEMLKMMFNREFGKDFMKGVTSITLIEYSDASEETCAALHKDLEIFSSALQEFDVSKESQFADNDYIRCFASASESATLSDFVIAMESDKSKMIIYMAGKIKVE